MNTIIVKTLNGIRVDRNSMYENELNKPINLNSLYSTHRGAQTNRKSNLIIPSYLGCDIDVKQSPLYKYLLTDI